MFLESEQIKHNQTVLSEIGSICKCDIIADFKKLLDQADITGKIEVVKTPKGDKQDESIGIFKDVYVDQWGVGDSGDAFEGFIYARFDANKWIKIPYYC